MDDSLHRFSNLRHTRVMQIQHFFDPRTWTLTYLVSDEASRTAVLIDSVQDFDPRAVRFSDESAQAVAKVIDEQGLELTHVLDTHVHADHCTAMPFFKKRYGARTVISANVRVVQATFAKYFDDDELACDGSQFDRLVEDGETFTAGAFEIEAIPTHGHTPASLSFRIGDVVFCGDVLFQPDSGTARCDFPGGSAEEEWDGIQRLYALPGSTVIHTGHDYQPGGRELQFRATVDEHRAGNVHCDANTTKEQFVARRAELDAGKPLPALIYQGLQVNMRAGHLPPASRNGITYLKMPVALL
jgi:glyoxylase-like metal-dependent hydrolase (beta-lactamase superfamily II)